MTVLGVRAVRVALATLVGGCQLEEGGFGTTAGSDGSTSAMTTAADATASTSRGNDASSSDATTVTSTSDSETGSTEGMTSATTEPPPATSSGSDAETGDPPPMRGEPYGPCGPGGMCMGPGAYCYENEGPNMCLPSCNGSSVSCPDAPLDNGSVVTCIEVPMPADPHCMLDCAGGLACPAGTDCVDLGDGIFRCLWP